MQCDKRLDEVSSRASFMELKNIKSLTNATDDRCDSWSRSSENSLPLVSTYASAVLIAIGSPKEYKKEATVLFFVAGNTFQDIYLVAKDDYDQINAISSSDTFGAMLKSTSDTDQLEETKSECAMTRVEIA